MQETPKFGGEEGQQDVQEKLQHMRSMMTYLEASRFKALNVMMDLESRPRVAHNLSSYIDYSKVLTNHNTSQDCVDQSHCRTSRDVLHDAVGQLVTALACWSMLVTGSRVWCRHSSSLMSSCHIRRRNIYQVMFASHWSTQIMLASYWSTRHK